MVSEFSEAFLLETERHAAWGAAQLDALAAFLPEGSWTADLSSCLYRQGDLELRVAVLGTYAMDERSWMWGWANPGLQGTEVVVGQEVVPAPAGVVRGGVTAFSIREDFATDQPQRRARGGRVLPDCGRVVVRFLADPVAVAGEVVDAHQSPVEDPQVAAWQCRFHAWCRGNDRTCSPASRLARVW